MKRLISDVHPPLYYLLLKPLCDLTNENMFCARILSAIFGIVLLWTGSLFLLHYFGKKSALFYAFFTYLNPFMIQKTTEIRMYMLASLFTVLSGILSYHIMKHSNKKYWVSFTITSILAAYTHYYALLVMIFIYTGILLYFIFIHDKKGIIAWVVCVLCTILGYAPWVPIAWHQVTAVNHAYWISMPDSRLAPLRELFYSAIPYTEHIYLGIIILLTLYAFIELLRRKTVESYWTLMCCSALWGILFFSMWYASHIRPILVSRYLIMAICLCILGISNIVRFLNKYIVITMLLFCSLIGSIRYQSAFRAQADRITTETVSFLTENQTPDDIIVYVNDGYGYLANCAAYYFSDINRICIDKSDGAVLENILSNTNGSVWFFDDNQYMSDLKDSVSDCSINDCGNYGFGSTKFHIYEIKKIS